MQQIAHSLPYKKELDGIRGIAIILVVLFHIWPEYFSFGFVGVDIFFVLSGYLITKIIVNKAENKAFRLYEFYRNRIRRIFPALIVVLSATMIVGYLFLFPEELKVLGKHVKSSALFYQNFRLIDEAGYWDESGQLKPLLHFWSLSIEEQFYILWPLLIIVLVRLKALSSLPLITLSLIWLSYSLNDEVNVFFHSLTRFWELTIGALIVWLERFSNIQKWTAKARYIIWLGLILSIAIFHQESDFHIGKTFLLVMNVALLILSLQLKTDRFLGGRLLVFIGVLSYPLYLWHYPIISYAHIFGISVIKNGLWILIISLILAYLTFRYIEVYARKQTNIRFIMGLVACVLIVAGVGQFLRLNDGLPNRAHLENIEKAKEQFIREPSTNERCIKLSTKILNQAPMFDYCKLSAQLKTEDYVAIIGDSHAHALYPGFKQQLARHKFQTILLSNSGCASFLGGERGKSLKFVAECKNKIEQIYKVLDSLTGLKKVIVVARGPKYIYQKGFGKVDNGSPPAKYVSYFLDEENYDPEAVYMASLNESVKYLTENNKEVYVFLENPELGFSPKSCIDRPFGIASRKCVVSYQAYKQRMSTYRSNVIAIVEKYPNAKVLDPESYLCDKENCHAEIDKIMLYADDDHFSVMGSQYIADKLINEVITQ